MSAAIKFIALLLIFLPYKVSELGRNASFTSDLLVAAVAFGIAYALIAMLGIDQEKNAEIRAKNRETRDLLDRL